MRFYATLPMGFERVSAGEISKIGGKILEIKDQRGRIFFEGKEELIPKLNFLSRTLERVMILLEHKEIDSLKDIYTSIRGLDFSFIKPNQSFAIRSLRVGNHDFTSLDISREAGQAVID
ncbi:MAG: class I SAM-dependent RNA methyltransferase, partial [Thermoplasmata archaeon]